MALQKHVGLFDDECSGYVDPRLLQGSLAGTHIVSDGSGVITGKPHASYDLDVAEEGVKGLGYTSVQHVIEKLMLTHIVAAMNLDHGVFAISAIGACHGMPTGSNGSSDEDEGVEDAGLGIAYQTHQKGFVLLRFGDDEEGACWETGEVLGVVLVESGGICFVSLHIVLGVPMRTMDFAPTIHEGQGVVAKLTPGILAEEANDRKGGRRGHVEIMKRSREQDSMLAYDTEDVSIFRVKIETSSTV